MSFNEPPDLWDPHAQQFADLDFEGPPYILTPEEDFTAYIQDLVDEVTDYCCIRFRPDRYEPLAYGRSVPKLFASIRERIRVISAIKGDALYQQEFNTIYQKVAARLSSYGMVARPSAKRILAGLLKQHLDLSDLSQHNNTLPRSMPNVVTAREEMAPGFEEQHGTDRRRDQEIPCIMESVSVANRLRAMHPESYYNARITEWDDHENEDEDVFATPGIPEKNAESYNDTPLTDWFENGDEDEDMFIFATPSMEVGIFDKKPMEEQSLVTPEELSPGHEIVEEDVGTPTPAPRIKKWVMKVSAAIFWESFKPVKEAISTAAAAVLAFSQAIEDNVSVAKFEEFSNSAPEKIATAIAAVRVLTEACEDPEFTIILILEENPKVWKESTSIPTAANFTISISEEDGDSEETVAGSKESSDNDVLFIKSSEKVIIEISSDESDEAFGSDSSLPPSQSKKRRANAMSTKPQSPKKAVGTAAEPEESSNSDTPPPPPPKRGRVNAKSTKPQPSKEVVLEEPAADSDESCDDEKSGQLEEDTPPKKRRATAKPAKSRTSKKIDRGQTTD